MKITENVVTKIAVCISGQVRFWETTYKLFEHWNKIYDNVEFVFFLSTWEDTGFDFSEYKFLQDVEVLSPDVIPKHIKSQYGHSNPYYTYQVQNVQKMRKKYEDNLGKKFDVVIQTREDMFIPRIILDEMMMWFNCGQIVSGMFFTSSGTKVVINRKVFPTAGGERSWSFTIPNDNYSFAHPDAMDEYAQMWNDCYIEKTNNETHQHFSNAQQLINKHIYNFKLGNQYHTYVIRPDELRKRKYPSEENLKNLIEKKGVEWIYSDDRPKTGSITREIVEEWFV